MAEMFGQIYFMDKDTQQFIIRHLRKATTRWKGRSDCLKRARKQTHDGKFTQRGKPVFKYMWQCAYCMKWFNKSSELEVDHIQEIGPFTGDWNEYIGRMFCGQENLQALCNMCHQIKTSRFNATLLYKRKK